MDDLELYEGREQSWVKHVVLSSYLERLAYKVSFRGAITYVDGFSGPWMSRSANLSDTSFHIAIGKLCAARDKLAEKRALRLRCVFVERNKSAFVRLREYVTSIDKVTIKLIHGRFERKIDEILKFVREEGSGFTFFFIDPTGWTGFGLSTIAPLLKQQHSEVLINFMTKDIIRFIDDERPRIRATFDDLFGSAEFRIHWRGLQGAAREEAIVDAYCRRVKEVGQFTHVVHAIVLNPDEDRTHFHLVYGTHHLEGLCVFRDAEQKALEEQRLVRARNRLKRYQRGGLGTLFTAEVLGPDRHIVELCSRCSGDARRMVESVLRDRKLVPYDYLLGTALEAV